MAAATARALFALCAGIALASIPDDAAPRHPADATVAGAGIGSGLLPQKVVRIACVGDSLTEGYHASDPSQSYPSLLQGLLGPGYMVLNYGHSGATLTGEQPDYPSKMPYSSTVEYQASLQSQANIVIIMIGSNDATGVVWPRFERAFVPIYGDLIRAYKNLASRPLVFVMVPPPLYLENAYGMLQSVINVKFQPLVRRIAQENRLPPAISIFDAFKAGCPDLQQNSCQYISGSTPSRDLAHDDGCHPNDDGYLLIARTVHAAIAPLARLEAGIASTVPRSFPGADTAVDSPMWAKRRLATSAAAAGAGARPEKAGAMFV